MKIKIGICDDERATCAALEKAICKYYTSSDLSVEVSVWYDGRSLMNDLKKELQLYILFLDIELPDVSGVEVGKYIRETICDETLQIVFISSKTAYAMELFQIHPYDFLIKPVSEAGLFKILKDIQSMMRQDSRYLTYPTKDGLKRVAVGDVRYIMSANKKICLCMNDGTEISFTGKLSEISGELPPIFIRASKSFMVNVRYIDTCSYDHVTMRGGDYISISQSHRVSFRQSFRRSIEGDISL